MNKKILTDAVDIFKKYAPEKLTNPLNPMAFEMRKALRRTEKELKRKGYSDSEIKSAAMHFAAKYLNA